MTDKATDLRGRATVLAVWALLAMAMVGPLVLAATSPLLAWRDTVYIVASFAGIVGLGLLLVQPMLAASWLPGLTRGFSRSVHRWVGTLLVGAVIVHVGGLWLTSPPDVIDVLLFRSPTPFAIWGALAMWAVFAAALLAALRKRLRLAPRTWKRLHLCFAGAIVTCTIPHAWMIEGTMETLSKAALCGLIALIAARVILARLLR